jgi:hypothetical protein
VVESKRDEKGNQHKQPLSGKQPFESMKSTSDPPSHRGMFGHTARDLNKKWASKEKFGTLSNSQETSSSFHDLGPQSNRK